MNEDAEGNVVLLEESEK